MNTLVILAAGKGTRLRPLTDDTPKCLLEVGGRPILNRLLEHFTGWSDKIIIVTGYLNEKIESHLETLPSDLPVTTAYNPDFGSTNSLYSAALPMEEWAGSSEVIFTNSDVVFKKGSLEHFLESDHAINLLVDVKECDREDMRVSVDESSDVVTRVSKEIPLEQSHGEFTGVARVHKASIPEFADVVRKLLKKQQMVEGGWYDLTFDYMAQHIRPINYTDLPTGSYYEIDTLEDYEEVKSAIE